MNDLISDAIAEKAVAQSGQNRLMGTSDNAQILGNSDASHEQDSHKKCHDCQGASGVFCLRWIEGRDAVADRLDTCQSCGTRRERSKHQQYGEWMGGWGGSIQPAYRTANDQAEGSIPYQYQVGGQEQLDGY